LKISFISRLLALGTLSLAWAMPAMAKLHAKGVYVGTSFGVTQLSGKRTDLISGIDQNTGLLTTYNVSSDQRIKDTSLEANVFIGGRFVPTNTPLALSLEGFFTYGPSEHTVFKDVNGQFTNQVATLKRGIGYGITARAGYIAHQQFMPYLLIGSRMDRFAYNSVDANAINLTAKKFLVGSDFGGGIETCLGSLKTALEFKYTYYHRTVRSKVESTTGDFITANARPRAASLSLRFIHVF